MRFLTLLLLLFFSANVQLAAFSSLPVQSDCDTILTQKGKTLIVHIVSQDRERVRYQYCGDSTSAVTRFITTKNIKEIRRGKEVNIKIEPDPNSVTTTPPADTTTGIVSSEIPADAVKVDAEQERRRAKRLSKLAAIFSFGTPFMVLFSLAFSPWFLLFITPMVILGMVYSIKATKASRRRPEFSKYYRMALFSLIISIIMVSIVALYLLILLIFLLFLLLLIV
jgi:hypothetical protein